MKAAYRCVRVIADDSTYTHQEVHLERVDDPEVRLTLSGDFTWQLLSEPKHATTWFAEGKTYSIEVCEVS